MRRLLAHHRWARLRRDALQLGVLAALCLAGYGRSLGRYFVSEDFFVLRRLAEGSFWETAWTHLTGPLLGISFVKFYRPVSAFLIHAEYQVWGTAPLPYHLTHLAVHLANAAMVYGLVRHWSGGRWAPAAGTALIFALYPLHANAVVFVAAFASVFGAAFLLASLWLYERARAGRGRLALAGSLVCFALALGSYEQTVVLPVFVLAREALAAWDDRREGARWKMRPALARWLPYLAVLAGYLLVRGAALGQMVAGYPGFRHRLLSGELPELGESILTGLVCMILPDYDHPVSGAGLVAAGLFVVLGSLASLRRGGPELRLWLFGLLWVLATQAPFAFESVVPGNGRYWYLASIGLGLLIAAAAEMPARKLAAASPRWHAGWVAAAATAVVGLCYFLLLIRYAGVYAEAGVATRTLQSRALELAGRGHRVFVAGAPDFLRGRRGIPVAQVFHWGLNDALRPPFVAGGPDVYPLPRFADAELLPVLERADLGKAWRYEAESATFEPLAALAPADVPRIAARRLVPGALQFRAGEGDHRLVLLTRGSASFYGAVAAPQSDGWTEASLPEAVVRSMRQLYGGEIYVWIEARRSGTLSAVSRLLEIDSAP